MDWGREVAFGPPRIARLKPSRTVRFTNRLQNRLFAVFYPSKRRDHEPGLSFIPSSVAHPHESRSGREPGPADRPRRRAVVIPGSPPGRRP